MEELAPLPTSAPIGAETVSCRHLRPASAPRAATEPVEEVAATDPGSQGADPSLAGVGSVLVSGSSCWRGSSFPHPPPPRGKGFYLGSLSSSTLLLLLLPADWAQG